MNASRTWLVSTLCAVLLWFLQVQTNHYLSAWNLSLFLYGLPIAFAALRLPSKDGWKIVLLLGLWVDAAAAARFGLNACAFLAIYTVIYHWRQRVPREETLIGVVMAIAGGTALFLFLTLLLLWRCPSPFALLPRVGVEVLASAVVTAVIGPWFFSLTEQALEIAGAGLRREQRGIL